jgi:hypothetical protein
MTLSIKMRATAIKTLLFLGLMSLAFACSNPNNNTPKADETAQTTPPKTDESITVNGTVKSVVSGKDGYTAEVQTEADGIYAALVSISNVGGPDNYKSCEVGDKVSFEGKPWLMGDVKQLTVKKIVNITASAQDVAAKYSKIQKRDYCWQVSKVLKLHKQPNASSKVEGEHFQGEVLSVLGTKMVGNQLWVNVKYALKVKPGYEDQFADGQVMPSGLPTGWIGGAETPTINCK